MLLIVNGVFNKSQSHNINNKKTSLISKHSFRFHVCFDGIHGKGEREINNLNNFNNDFDLMLINCGIKIYLGFEWFESY